MHNIQNHTMPPQLASRRHISHSEPTTTQPEKLVFSIPNPSTRCDSVEKLYQDAHPEDVEDQREGVLLLDFASPHVTEHVAENRRRQGMDALPGIKVNTALAFDPTPSTLKPKPYSLKPEP
jgi:hypothetical protein